MEIKELHYTAPGTVPYFNVSKRVYWGAIFAGSFVTAGATLLLRALGFLFMTVPAPPAAIVPTLHFGTALWWLITGPVCFYTGGWTAGRLTGIARIDESVIHGVISWALASLALAAWGSSLFLGSMETVASRGTWLYAFLIMCCELGAGCAGAANGTRLLVPSDLVSQQAVEAHRSRL